MDRTVKFVEHGKLNLKSLGLGEWLSRKNPKIYQNGLTYSFEQKASLLSILYWSHSPPPLPWKQNEPSNSFEDSNMEKKTQGASVFCCFLWNLVIQSE